MGDSWHCEAARLVESINSVLKCKASLNTQCQEWSRKTTTLNILPVNTHNHAYMQSFHWYCPIVVKITEYNVRYDFNIIKEISIILLKILNQLH